MHHKNKKRYDVSGDTTLILCLDNFLLRVSAIFLLFVQTYFVFEKVSAFVSIEKPGNHSGLT